ncbi:MAG: FAD-dependent monooxygenase [Alphaproteobacteria bacterium]|nr:FAD-dependent monooxygenase [Alphaproteobacteria bacterium]
MGTPPDRILVEFSHDGLLFVAPLKGGRARIIADVTGDVTEADEATVRAIMAARSPVLVEVSDPAWMTVFRISERQVPRYRHDRIFLAGDAAHIHSPAGGQGMNTGMQDAYNLGWKLELALKQNAGDGLLESYHDERHPVGAMVLATTGRMLRMIDLKSMVGRFTRDTLIGLLGPRETVQSRMRQQLSQHNIAYHDSAITLNDWHHGRQAIKAGDRAPDGHPTTLFEVMRGPGHLVLGFADGADAGADAVRHVVEAAEYKHPDMVKTMIVSRDRPGWRDPEGELHKRYGASGPCHFVIRPDGYIGLASNSPDLVPMGRYLGGILQHA